MREVDCIGDPWSLLIRRDALYGMTRFDEWERSPEIAPNILMAPLKTLVEDGLKERCCYSDRPPRYDCRIIGAGQDATRSVRLIESLTRRTLPAHNLAIILIDKLERAMGFEPTTPTLARQSKPSDSSSLD